ncbi:MAG: hypothetical protein LBQ81_04920 [Zoogloeaceae bacterium]|jgi:hypothetical protein|nr:hypothetical protein [Zoogloeaceae bacterium]
MPVPLLPAPRSWRWICAAYAIFRQKPVLICSALVFYFSLSSLLSTLPHIGTILSMLVGPCLTVSLMNLILRPRPTLTDIFQPFRAHLKPLLGLALALMTGLLLTLSLLALVDSEFVRALSQPDALEALFKPENRASTLALFALLTPVFMAYWFAPLLVAWRQFSIAKAMFFSFMAILRNWRAILGCILLFSLLFFSALVLTALASTLSLALARILLALILLVTAALNFCLTGIIYLDFFPPPAPKHISELA